LARPLTLRRVGLILRSTASQAMNAGYVIVSGTSIVPKNPCSRAWAMHSSSEAQIRLDVIAMGVSSDSISQYHSYRPLLRWLPLKYQMGMIVLN
jgi:hypothetical protein